MLELELGSRKTSSREEPWEKQQWKGQPSTPIVWSSSKQLQQAQILN
jgi:hypothetical protein